MAAFQKTLILGNTHCFQFFRAKYKLFFFTSVSDPFHLDTFRGQTDRDPNPTGNRKKCQFFFLITQKIIVMYYMKLNVYNEYNIKGKK